MGCIGIRKVSPAIEFGFGFLINTVAYEGGRSAGSLAWAGLQNTFYWIDPPRQTVYASA